MTMEHAMTIYVEKSAGKWEARYWHTDEQQYYRFTDYDQDTAIKKAMKDTGYSKRECKIICT